MIKKTIIGFVFMCFTMSCQDTQTRLNKKASKRADTLTKIEHKQRKQIAPIIKKAIVQSDSVVSFFTKYGNKHRETQVILKTRLGDIHLELYKETYLHRANFLFLINEGYFNTTCFHRVVENFIIQAGQSDNPKTGFLRHKIGNYKLPPEFVSKYKHHKGALSSARRWNQNPKKLSDAFEFFIVHDKKGLHHLDQEHTTFGRITKGIDVLDKIAKESIDKGEWPLHDIMLDISIK